MALIAEPSVKKFFRGMEKIPCLGTRAGKAASARGKCVQQGSLDQGFRMAAKTF